MYYRCFQVVINITSYDLFRHLYSFTFLLPSFVFISLMLLLILHPPTSTMAPFTYLASAVTPGNVLTSEDLELGASFEVTILVSISLTS